MSIESMGPLALSDSSDRRETFQSYEALLSSLALPPTRRGPWAHVGSTERKQGWKLHVSTIAVQAGRLIETLAPWLREHEVRFKTARDEPTLFMLNEGVLGPTQIGKFMTIYPPSDESARGMAEHLVRATTDFDGPVVMTDLRLGRVVYARFGGFNPVSSRDRLGQVMTMLERPDGTLEPDERKVPFAAPEWVSNPFADFPLFNPPASVTAGTGRLFGPGYLLLSTLKPNPKGSVFLALEMRDRATVGLKIMKEGRRHCLSDSHGRDIRNRLRRQLSLHRALKGRAPIPAAEHYFEVAGNGYLVVEHVDGETLSARESRPFAVLDTAERIDLIARLLDVLAAVEALHAAGYAHRDLAPSNVMITADNSVRLIDLELAARVGSDEPVFSRGTPGFMSPQQEAGEPASYADDIFAFGCLMVLLMSQIDPRRVLFAPERDRQRQVQELTESPPPLDRVIADCIATAPETRPNIAMIRRALEGARAVCNGPSASKPPTGAGHAESIRETRSRAAGCVAGAARGLLQDVLTDEATGMWLSPVVRAGAATPVETASSFTLYRSASRGVAGVVYGLARMARCGVRDEMVRPRVEAAVDWLLAHHPTSDDQMPGLHFGEAGVAVAIAEACAAGLIDHADWMEGYLDEALNGPLDWLDLTHGAAGQGLAALICADVLGDSTLVSASHRCAEYLMQAQDADGGWTLPQGVEGMTGEQFTGFAHGVAGMVYFLAEHASRVDSHLARQAAIQGAQWLEAKALNGPNRGLEWRMKESNEERWRWWCNGGPGIALAFLKLFERTKEHRFAKLAEQALRVLPADLRYSNLSQCHGLAGIGEVYLEAERLIGGGDWLIRAARLANLLMQLAGRGKSGGVAWLVEDPFKATGDLMIGSAGVAHFLLRFASDPTALGLPLLLDPQ
jgi:Lanthionine synthetase C-like protein/Protein kinase domain